MSVSKALIALSLALSAVSVAQAHNQIIPDSGGAQEFVLNDGREIVADRSGLTVYSFDPDQAGPSVCYDGCAKEWPPVLVAETEVLKAPFASSKRKDGTLQLTYENKPLYNYDDDKKAGDIAGENKHKVWHLIVLEEAAK